MWRDYLRNEEAVKVLRFDGTDGSMRDLLEDFPDSFELRVNDSGTTKYYNLIAKDEMTHILIHPGDYIVIDSCGHVYAYEQEYFEFMFRPYKDDEGIEALAMELQDTSGSRYDWEDTSEADKELRRKQAIALLEEYVIVRR